MKLAAAGVLIALCFPSEAQVHASPMAGRWFPADREALNRLLDAAYAAADRRSPGPPRPQLLGLVAPHAGLQYSGTVAASSYRLLGDIVQHGAWARTSGTRVQDRSPNIILLAFPHRFPLEGIAVPKVSAYSTPLGEVRVNREVVASLGFRELEEKALCDHSLENQLPFLQRSAPQASIIPLYVGRLNGGALRSAARKLAARVKQGDVIIASSDFTHYGENYGYTPFPNDGQVAGRLRARAQEAFERVGSMNVGFFDRFLAETGDTICGRDPIRLLMATLALVSPDVYMAVADSATSGELIGDYASSVTYGSLAFYPAASFEAGETERKLLLQHSRSTLNHHLGLNGNRNGVAGIAGEALASLAQRTGVFVTIRKKGELRGCVGVLAPDASLPATVASRTLAAASSDPRFPALSVGEGPVTLEISLLTPLKRLPDWRAYEGGLGGVLTLDGRAGLLLPQVAREMNWTPQQFLEGLSAKAGLDAKAYRNPRARLYVFSAQVFGE